MFTYEKKDIPECFFSSHTNISPLVYKSQVISDVLINKRNESTGKIAPVRESMSMIALLDTLMSGCSSINNRGVFCIIKLVD